MPASFRKSTPFLDRMSFMAALPPDCNLTSGVYCQSTMPFSAFDTIFRWLSP